MKFYGLVICYIAALAAVVYFTNDRLTILLIVLASFVFSLLVFWGVSVMRLNLFIKSQSRINANNNEVALTFDDGPLPQSTPQILDLLKKHKAKATFFCIGSNIKDNGWLLKRIIDEGHSVGNHSFEHIPAFTYWGIKKVKQSIEKTDRLIEEITGKKTNLFRPPYGVTNNLMAHGIQKLNKKVVGWSIRTKDTCRSVEEVVTLVEEKVKPGAIILLHDSNPRIEETLRKVLEVLEKKNLKSIALK